MKLEYTNFTCNFIKIFILHLFIFLGNITHSKVVSSLSQLPFPFAGSHVARGHSMSRC